MGQFTANNLNPILRVEKDGTVLYSNVVDEPLLHEWVVKVGAKLPFDIRDLVKRTLKQNIPEKIEVQIEKRKYLIFFHPLPETESVNIYGFDISDLKEKETLLHEAYEQIQVLEELHGSNEASLAQSSETHSSENHSSETHEPNRLLHDNETAFRTLAENSPDLITRFDRQNYCLYANSAAMRFYDFPTIAKFYGFSVDERTSKTSFKVQIDPEMAKFSEKQRANVFATGDPQAMEFHYTSSQGKEYYFDTKIVPEFFAGEITSVLVISRDITAIKESEAKLNEMLGNLEKLVKERTDELEKAYNLLKESEKGLAEAQKMAHMGNWDWNLVTNEFYYSDELYRIFGLNPQEFDVPFDQVLTYIHPEDRDHVINSIMESLNGKIYDAIDFRIISADGTEHAIHTQGEVIFDETNTPVRMRGTVQDITESKKIEQKLRESEEKYRNIVETSNEGIYFVNDEGKVTFANKMMETSGYSLDEIIGRPVWNFVPEEGLPVAKKEFEKRMKGISGSYELKLIRKDGSYIWTHITAKPFFNKKGKFKGYLAMMADITERKEMEEKLQESEEKYRNIVEVANEGIGINDSEFRITYANKRMADMLGYTLEEGIGGSVWDFLSEESKALVKLNLEKKRLGIDGGYELKLIRKDGSPIWTHMNSKPLLDEEGKYLGSVSMFTDITKRKEAEEKLLESEQKYRNIIETTNEGIVIIDSDLRITYVNNRLLEEGGYSQEEVIGRLWWDFTDEEGKNIANLHMDKRRRGIDEIYELRLMRKDGSSFWVLVSSKSLFDKNGKFAGSLSMLTDVTERKEAEEKIKSLANIVESSNDAIITKSLDGIITSWNKGAEQIYGYSTEEILGKNISIIEPDNLKGEIKQLTEEIKQGKNIKHYETSRLKKDGTLMNVSVTLSPIIDRYGKLVAISCIGGDITEKVIAEKLLQEKKMADVANRTKSEFLANISHELRTPLNSIIGFSEMLHEQAYGELNEKQLRVSGNISKSGKHLLNLINNLLDISKVESGKMELNYGNFELASKLNTIRNLLSPIADRKNIKIEIEMDSKLTSIRADEDKFVQIMYNLVDNAIKFSYENSRVKIEARKKGDLVEITVNDIGIGIPIEDQYKLFKPFSRIDYFSSRKSQGTGLGLSLVKQIVHLHGGYVWFRSNPSKGSTFAFAFPINNNKEILDS